MRVAIPFAVGLLLFVGCTDSSSDSTRAPAKVPIPQVSSPSNASLDMTAWQRMWRDTPGSPRHRCLDVKDRTDVRERGHWRLEAFAGRNRGCFELQL